MQLNNQNLFPAARLLEGFHDPRMPEVRDCFQNYTLNSHFQPVFSLSVQRPVGYEALLRAEDEACNPVTPAALFGRFYQKQREDLDRLTHRMHLKNFLKQLDPQSWLFLNMTPDVFLKARHEPAGQAFGTLLADLGFPAHRVVVEVLEEAVRDTEEFESAVAFFRELGCLIALDDFGAGSSNFDRVWKIRPQIVKLDRSLIHQAARNARVRRILPQLISLLHEAGSMVLIEGVETADEAYIALDANADFVQGYLFGYPQATLGACAATNSALSAVWQEFDRHLGKDWVQQKNALAPYKNAIGNASVLLSAGRLMPEACASFFELDESCICYLLDDRGQQIGFNLWSGNACPHEDQRLEPLRDTRNARWSRAPYFRRAMENFGKVQVTRPYLSTTNASMCVTVSVSFRFEGQIRVICGDIRWQKMVGE